MIIDLYLLLKYVRPIKMYSYVFKKLQEAAKTIFTHHLFYTAEELWLWKFEVVMQIVMSALLGN